MLGWPSSQLFCSRAIPCFSPFARRATPAGRAPAGGEISSSTPAASASSSSFCAAQPPHRPPPSASAPPPPLPAAVGRRLGPALRLPPRRRRRSSSAAAPPPPRPPPLLILPLRRPPPPPPPLFSSSNPCSSPRPISASPHSPSPPPRTEARDHLPELLALLVGEKLLSNSRKRGARRFDDFAASIFDAGIGQVPRVQQRVAQLRSSPSHAPIRGHLLLLGRWLGLPRRPHRAARARRDVELAG